MISHRVAVSLYLLRTLSAADFPVAIQATRLPANPMIAPAMLPPGDGDSINGPSLIRVPDWVDKPLGRYYLYFGHHNGKYIRLAYANKIEGPWTVKAGGVLSVGDQSVLGGHIASPEAVVDQPRKRILLYLHGKPAGAARTTAGNERDPEAGQRSIVAVSTDGLRFQPSNQDIAPAYLRVFQRGGVWYGINHHMLLRAAQPQARFEPVTSGITDQIMRLTDAPKRDRPKSGPDRYSIRHVGVDIFGEWLLVYYTCVGDNPERIFAAAVEMKGDAGQWQVKGIREVLRPETVWEGADLPLAESKGGRSRTRVRQLRDPAVFVENGRRWLLYSVAGEDGLAIAELRYTVKPDFVPKAKLERPEPLAPGLWHWRYRVALVEGKNTQ